MKGKIVWLLVSCLIVVALLLVSRSPALTKVEAAAPAEEVRLSELEEIHFELLGATGGPTTDVALVDIAGCRYALVTNGFLLVVDVSEPSTPRTVAKDCRVEIIMKDVHTLNNEPARLPRWVEIAREVIDEVA